jgi:ribosomal protein L11 methylase PrmA
LTFGLGDHQPRCCRCEIQEVVFDGATVLDVGCGSGYSALSLVLGAATATIDSWRRSNTGTNASANGVADRVDG